MHENFFSLLLSPLSLFKANWDQAPKYQKRFFSREEEEMKIGLWILHVSFARSKEHPAAELTIYNIKFHRKLATCKLKNIQNWKLRNLQIYSVQIFDWQTVYGLCFTAYNLGLTTYGLRFMNT